MDALTILAPPESEGLRRLCRWHAYVCATLAGFGLYFVTTNTHPFTNNGEKIFAAAGPVWLLSSVVLIVLASRDPGKRVSRLLACIIICLCVFALCSVLPLHENISSAFQNVKLSFPVVLAVTNLIILSTIVWEPSLHIGHIVAVLVNLPVLLSVVIGLINVTGSAVLIVMALR
jgi:hypothetical protein